MESFVYDFPELGKEDNERVGKKCANLGELSRAGFRVPPGFAVTLGAYTKFMTRGGLVGRIEEFLAPLKLDPAKAADIRRFEEVSAAIRLMVEETPVPPDIDSAVRERYRALCGNAGEVPVATRSAGPASHPGQYETYLNISGAAAVVRNVVRVWSSTFNARSLIARIRQGLPAAYDPIGVAVVKMVNAKAAGVMFTVNPSTGDPSKVYIESNWGLGESVVAGEVAPDSFVVDRASRKILKRTVSSKAVWYVPDPQTGLVSAQEVPRDKRDSPSLQDEEVLELTRLGGLIEEHFGTHQDIEWAVDSTRDFPENVFLLQARPIAGQAPRKSPTDRIIDLMMRDITGI